MSKEDDLREILNQAAKAIAETQSNPRTWHSWVVYLLGQMETQATTGNPSYRETFTEMLTALQESIRNRFRTGSW